jgi:ATP-dependent Clp endopeptidase proteolytic subunit ClpP
VKIDIKGSIVSDDYQEVYDWFGIAATSPAVVKNAIKEAESSGDKELLVEINSGGGSVFAGAEIYYALMKFEGTVNVEIPSLAASAASFIAMAGKKGKISMSLMGQMMIHNASTYTSGNYQDMDATSEFLKNIDASIINAYMTKTSKTRDEIQEMMDKTTWFTAQQALESGLIDEILFENEIDAAANVSSNHPALVNGVLPKEVIDKVKKDILAGGLPQVVNSMPTQEPTKNTENEGGSKLMDYQTLKNDHPELFNQVKNEGIEEGKKAENARIKGIEDLALPGNESLINEAKFEKDLTAEQLAVEIIKAEKAKGGQLLNNLRQDAQPLNNVPGSEATSKATEDDKVVAEFESIWGGEK